MHSRIARTSCALETRAGEASVCNVTSNEMDSSRPVHTPWSLALTETGHAWMHAQCIQSVLSREITVHIVRVSQNCIYTPYLTVHLVTSLPNLPCIHRIT
jgi:hypothetical protein